MSFIRELKGEVMILIAILRKETRAYDLAMAVWHLERHSVQQSSLCHPPLLYTSLRRILKHIGPLAPPLLPPRLPPQPLSYP